MKKQITPRNIIKWVVSTNEGLEWTKEGSTDPESAVRNVLKSINPGEQITILERHCSTSTGFRPIYTFVFTLGKHDKTYRWYVFDSKDY